MYALMEGIILWYSQVLASRDATEVDGRLNS